MLMTDRDAAYGEGGWIGSQPLELSGTRPERILTPDQWQRLSDELRRSDGDVQR